jgi:hypothetical protein
MTRPEQFSYGAISNGNWVHIVSRKQRNYISGNPHTDQSGNHCQSINHYRFVRVQLQYKTRLRSRRMYLRVASS